MQPSLGYPLNLKNISLFTVFNQLLFLKCEVNYPLKCSESSELIKNKYIIYLCIFMHVYVLVHRVQDYALMAF